MGKLLKSFRLSPEAERLLRELAEQLGVSQTAVIELALREKGDRMGLAKAHAPTRRKR